jgi:hypothetical protein
MNDLFDLLQFAAVFLDHRLSELIVEQVDRLAYRKEFVSFD